MQLNNLDDSIDQMKTATDDTSTATLATLLNQRTPGLGNRYQDGVGPGRRKLEQFQECLGLRQAPPLASQENFDDPLVLVKLFDPCGSWSWYITEWDGNDTAFGWVEGDFPELGYMSLAELASVRGPLGIGIELDMHWAPRRLSECMAQRLS